MTIKIIDYGLECMPFRAHENDAGADVYSPIDLVLDPHKTWKIPLHFGLELPDGMVGFVFPRSSLSARGIVCQLPPIDSGYRGEIHAVVTNTSSEPYLIEKNDRIGQLVIFPVITPTFVTEKSAERGSGAFGSTGK
jgi:dUTP pyrophosphatase